VLERFEEKQIEALKRIEKNKNVETKVLDNFKKVLYTYQ